MVVLRARKLNDKPEIQVRVFSQKLNPHEKYRIIGIITSKLGTTEKEKKQEETDGTIILFLYPLIFDTKIPRD